MSRCDPIKTTCPYCGVGCGVEASVSDENIIAVSGDDQHPANWGKLCVKGAALQETVGAKGRLTDPHIDGQPVDWTTAIETVADRLQRIRDQYGPDAIAFYLSGQLLTEDYYVTNKLAKGFIGTGHVDTNSRLCMSSAVAGYKRAFGSDAVPCNYEDLEATDLLVLTGSNAAWTHPVLYRRMVAAKQRNPKLKVVVIDPRRTATCDLADLHLAIAPGSDGFLFSGLLNYIIAKGYADHSYIEQFTEGFEQATADVQSADCEQVAAQTRLDPVELTTFYQWFCEAQKTITFYSQGINQSSTGTDKCNAIINCHLATAKLGKPGCGPFSITGQPNAMGGREVGGLANMLAAHMDYCEQSIATVGQFWGAENLSRAPGLKAVELFDALAEGRIKAIWIMGTNPVVSMPNADLVQAALQQCETVIVSDCIAATDTTATANILLPATGWSEKDGTVTNSERRISRQRSLLPPIGEARHDWWIITQVAQAMGFAGSFDYQSPRDIFIEHAALSGFNNQGSRLFDISGLSQLSEQQYDQLQPIQWPVNTENPNGTARLFADGVFNTPSGRARFIRLTGQLPQQALSADYPLALNTGRIRDQWHTMTRTGRTPRLLDHIDQPFVALHPQTAEQFNVEDGNLVEVSTAQGSIQVIALFDAGIKVDQLFVPIHWNNQFASNARVDTLVASIVDPISGQPEFKYTPASLKKIDTAYWAAVVTRSPLPSEHFINWSQSGLENQSGYLYRVAVDAGFNWQDFLALKRLEEDGPPQAYEQYANPENFDQRTVCYSDQQVEMVIFCHRDPSQLPSRSRLIGLLDQPFEGNYWSLIANNTSADQGKLICSCHRVTEPAIVNAIKSGCHSPEQLGQKLKCGTNCGSCIPELNHLITQTLSLT